MPSSKVHRADDGGAPAEGSNPMAGHDLRLQRGLAQGDQLAPLNPWKKTQGRPPTCKREEALLEVLR